MENAKVIQEVKDEVAGQLRAIRAFRNKTQKEVAKGAGVGVSRLCQIEQGKVNVKIGTLGRIVVSLGCRLTFRIDQQ